MCTVLLPPGGYPIAVNKYIIYHIWGLVFHIEEEKRLKNWVLGKVYRPERYKITEEWRRLHNGELYSL
jgi:hypothetical protein